MKIGILAGGGDTVVRAAHSLAADPAEHKVVVIGRAESKAFDVERSADSCDILVGSGPAAPRRAAEAARPLVWGGEIKPDIDGPVVWGASPVGLALALAASEEDVVLVALGHPDNPDGSDLKVRFPQPLGRRPAVEAIVGGKPLALSSTPGPYAAALVRSTSSEVVVLDDARFMSGICLAAGVSLSDGSQRPAWEDGTTYLRTVAAMGLVIGRRQTSATVS